MRLVATKACPPGARLAKCIFNEQGLVLLGERVELTQSMLDRLISHGIHYIYIEDHRTDDIVVPDLITDATRSRAIQELRTQFRKIVDENIRSRGMASIQTGKHLRSLMELILDDLTRNKDALIMITNMSITDHYLFSHSLNVSMYATLLGMAMGMSKDELMVLGLGALLHDIGKMQLPLDLLYKPGKLTDDEFALVKQHAEIGFKLLKDIPNLPLISAHCAYQHHERVDGSGYPRGLKGDEIHEYAKLIGLCDVYDAMTSHRSYRSAHLPHDAMEMIYAVSGKHFEQEHIELFRSKVAIYPLGMTVKLSTGETGVVVDLNASCLHRPVVRVLEDEFGQALKEPYEIDLSKRLSISIEGISES
jgi:uncharacterized domain HDIG